MSESVWPYVCAQCGERRFRRLAEVNRAEANGAKLFCNKVCFGLSLRKNKTKAQKVADKAAYDAEYRQLNREALKIKKAAHYQRTRDPEREREIRKANMPRHVEYCRRPEYRKWKAQYDRKYRSTKDFGAFGEAAILLNDLQAEILSRATRYEIDLASGTLNKKLKRRRDYDKAYSG